MVMWLPLRTGDAEGEEWEEMPQRWVGRRCARAASAAPPSQEDPDAEAHFLAVQRFGIVDG